MSDYHVYYREEEMLPYAFCYLNELYPKRKGWELHFVHDAQMFWPHFIVEKMNGKGLKTVIALVRMEEAIDENPVEEMRNYERLLCFSKNRKIEKILIVPTGCDTSKVPSDIRIIFLKEFSFKSS